LSKVLHPDKNTGGEEEKQKCTQAFIKVHRAYSEISRDLKFEEQLKMQREKWKKPKQNPWIYRFKI